MMTEIVLAAFLGLFSYQDIRKQEISLWALVAAGGCGVAFLVLQTFDGWPDVLFRLLPGAALLLAALLSRGRIGAGDGMVFLVSGLFLDAAGNLELMAGSFMYAAGTAAVLLVTRKRKRDGSFAFVPCILAAYLTGLLIAGGGNV